MPGTDLFDVVVVGAGIVGLATARQLLIDRPGISVVVLDKEAQLGRHQTSHNSGVLHAGLYYQPGSLKARLCREGKAEMERFADEHGVPYNRCGKLVVAIDPDELGRFDDLHKRAIDNGIEGLEVLGPSQLRDREPHAAGIRALWSPSTGIINYLQIAHAMADDIRNMGGQVLTSMPVTAIAERADAITVTTPTREFRAVQLVACAGVHADQVAALSGEAGDDRIIPFRGDYYTLSEPAAKLVNGLIYPVPDPRFPFLGVHLTRTVDDRVIAGPNAVLAFAREGYRRTDLDTREVASVVAYPGFRVLARKFWRTGAAEMWRDVSKRAFLKELQRYLPALEAGHLTFGPSGVRAQAVERSGELDDDFRLGGSGRVLHVRNAPSPAATASLAIGRTLAGHVNERLAATA